MPENKSNEFVQRMITSNDLRPGTTFKLPDGIFRVISYNHNKQARGSAVVTTKLRNILTGSTVNKTFRGGEKIEDIKIEMRPMQFLYNEDAKYYFMNQSTYDQLEIPEDIIGEDKYYLKEEMIISIQFFEEKIIGITLPANVELKIEYTEPGVKGDTVSGATKPAKLETGLSVNVPLFVNPGEIIRVDTRTGAYIERVK